MILQSMFCDTCSLISICLLWACTYRHTGWLFVYGKTTSIYLLGLHVFPGILCFYTCCWPTNQGHSILSDLFLLPVLNGLLILTWMFWRVFIKLWFGSAPNIWLVVHAGLSALLSVVCHGFILCLMVSEFLLKSWRSRITTILFVVILNKLC